ncbi:MAG: cytochrome c3 family protein [Terriglobales bacterium]
MKHRFLSAAAWLVLAAGSLLAQINTDVIGIHNLGPGSQSPISGGLSGACLYCHAPHSGVGSSTLSTPLWNQTLTTQTYTPYRSSTYVEQGNPQPPLGQDSNLCMSCHDGTVAPGLTAAYGKVPMAGSMYASDVFGTNLQSSHPFSLVLPMKDSADLVATLVSQGRTSDPTGAVKLIKGNIECTSCHNPHVQSVDPIVMDFLVRNSSSGQLCLACHDPNRVMTGKINGIAGWSNSIHALAPNKTTNQPSVGGYPTVAQNACEACHAQHQAAGPLRLLRGTNEQDCMACHNGGSNVSPAAPNVFAEYQTPKIGHPFPAGNNTHDAAESMLLNQNRHATCVDCHDAHATHQVAIFPIPPVIRVSQNLIAGISALDGITVLQPAINQYENCLRCHGNSTGKVTNPVYGYTPIRAVSAGDPLNVIPQFSTTATSSHPVTHPRSSPLPQPSLLSNMTMIDGISQGRAMGTQILCTDCHNSDDNREFGGSGPNGPHGSKWTHILERQYVANQSPGPGQLITNLYPNPNLTVSGPYALCGKCHDLAGQIIKNTSFTQHAFHINSGFSCSVCHTPHGVGGVNPNISGQRLVNFDVNVVAQNGASPISYNRATNTCVLTCHTAAHNSNGSVTAVGSPNKVGLGSPKITK